MYSQCPECLTRFRVTAAALRGAHGVVRCGRCGIAFDALERLTDGLTDPAEPALATAGPDGGALRASGDDGAIGTEFHFSADDIERVFVDARDWERRFGDAPPGPTGAGETEVPPSEVLAALEAAARPAPPPDVFVHEPEAVEDITMEGERIVIEGLPDYYDEPLLDDDAIARKGDAPVSEPYTGEPDAVPLPTLVADERARDLDATDSFEALRIEPTGPSEGEPDEPIAAPEAAVPPVAVDLPGPAIPAPIVAAPAPTPVSATRSIGSIPIERPPFRYEEEIDEPETARSHTLAWSLGALVLALTLAAQIAHHYRDRLARDPAAGPYVRDLYSRLGLSLAPAWDLDAFEVRQWGPSAPQGPGTDGRMNVRASLRNGASYAQPLPLLRLELEDRFGATVARRDFQPREYLKDPAQATRQLTSGASAEAQLEIVAASTDAVGYRLDVCLADDAGVVRCAQSAPPDAP